MQAISLRIIKILHGMGLIIDTSLPQERVVISHLQMATTIDSQDVKLI